MSKITCFVLCAVAVSISSVYAKISDEEKAAFHDAIKPILTECSQEHGVSDADIKSAKEAGNADAIKPCFLGCVFKKTGIFNDEGKFDLDAGLSKLRKFVKNDEDFAKFEEIGKQCTSVNDEPVTDEAAGCERAMQLVSCGLQHKAEIPI